MKILKLMKCNPKTINPDSSLTEAAKIMRKSDLGVLPVVENGEVIGMITDRDITIRSTSHGQDPNTTSVRSAMTKKAYYCYDDEDLKQAGKKMLSKKVGRLPVVNRETFSLAGIISLADIILAKGGKRMITGSNRIYAIPALAAIAAGFYGYNKISQKFWESEPKPLQAQVV